MRIATTSYTFREVGFPSTKTGKCPVCGKPTRRTQKFFQTLNPFNTNAQGQPKTAAEIIAELRIEAAAWKTKPCYHVKCEP